MQQQLATHRKRGWRFIAVIGGMLFFALPGQANEGNQCLGFYEAISARHTKALSSLAHDTAAFYRRMHELEDELFNALGQCPKDPRLFSLMAENQISLNNLQLARLYASKAHQQRPDLWQTNHALGTVLVMQKRYKHGLPLLEKALQIASHKPALHFNLCSSYVVAEHYAQALAACSRLLDLKGHELHGPAYYQRSLAYRALGKNQQADADLAKARSIAHRPGAK